MKINAQSFSFCGPVKLQSPDLVRQKVDQSIAQGIKEIHVEVNCTGGLTLQALEIYEYLRAVPIHVFTYNYSEVSSAGFLIFLAGQKRFGHARSRYMTHHVIPNPSRSAISPEKLAEFDAQLREENCSILSIFLRSGIALGESRFQDFHTDVGTHFIHEEALSCFVAHATGEITGRRSLIDLNQP